MGLLNNLLEGLKLNELKQNISQFVEAQLGLLKLDFTERVEDGFSKLSYYLIGFVLIVAVLIQGGILFALYLNQVLGGYYMGFVVVLGVFLVLFLLWYLCKTVLMAWLKIGIESLNNPSVRKNGNTES